MMGDCMNEEIRNSYEISSLKYIGNSNSLHSLGVSCKKLENASGKQILEVLKLINKEIIYTSGDSENFSFILSNISDEKAILTDNKEFYEIGKMMNKNIEFGNIRDFSFDDFYLISTSIYYDFKDFKGLVHFSLNSDNYNCDLNRFDFISIEDCDLPFFGCVIKNKNKELVPLICGGKSTTKYRSGTSPVPLIVAFSKLIKLKYKK